MRETSSFGLLYHGRELALTLRAYCDAGVQLHNYCTTGFVITFGGAAVARRSHRYERTSGSFACAEYRAAVDAAKEIIWLRFLLEFLLCPQAAVPLYCDNKTTVQAMNGDSVRDLKEICRLLPFIRDSVKAGELQPRFILGKEQPADFLTKPLLGPAFFLGDVEKLWAWCALLRFHACQYSPIVLLLPTKFLQPMEFLQCKVTSSVVWNKLLLSQAHQLHHHCQTV